MQFLKSQAPFEEHIYLGKGALGFKYQTKGWGCSKNQIATLVNMGVELNIKALEYNGSKILCL